MSTNKKPRSRRLHPFEKELIASIENERRHFGMGDFVVGAGSKTATCGTASCMAGHIAALRRPLAQRLAKKEEFWCDLLGQPRHDKIADEIYRRETGKECPLDFYGYMTKKSLGELSREDAISHIKGVHPNWPLLGQK